MGAAPSFSGGMTENNNGKKKKKEGENLENTGVNVVLLLFMEH